MKRIQVLNDLVADKIAAGEVVERPAPALKELIENAIDAGSTAISIDYAGGGMELLRVADNGSGILADDVRTAFLRHATSKIRNSDDLNSIATLGFRGEALPSIAAVSQLTMKTRTADSDFGTQICINGGVIKSFEPCGCPEGTCITVENLFYNVPARKAFIKSPRTEANKIIETVSKFILSYPSISFKLTGNGRLVCKSLGDGILKNAIYGVYGAEVMDHLRDIHYDDGYIKIDGVIGDETMATPGKQRNSLFINGRCVNSNGLAGASARAFETRIMKGTFPLLVASIAISPEEVNVNIHPNKLEVRFKDEERVSYALINAIQEGLKTYAMREIVDVRSKAPASRQTPIYEPHCTSPYERAEDTLFKSRDFIKRASQIEMNDSADMSKASKDSSQTYDSSPKDKETSTISDHDRRLRPDAASSSRLYGVERPYRIVGCVFNTYWIIEQEDEVLMLDQHAAHERVLYERYINQTSPTPAQELLVPVSFKLSPSELDAFADHKELFASLSFIIDCKPDGYITISAIPSILNRTDAEVLFREAIQTLMHDRELSTDELRRSAVIMAACKHAVKAGTPIDTESIKRLISAFNSGDIPLTCPHGRPIIVKLKKTEFERFFKRII